MHVMMPNSDLESCKVYWPRPMPLQASSRPSLNFEANNGEYNTAAKNRVPHVNDYTVPHQCICQPWRDGANFAILANNYPVLVFNLRFSKLQPTPYGNRQHRQFRHTKYRVELSGSQYRAKSFCRRYRRKEGF
jgi:hypothetical protein